MRSIARTAAFSLIAGAVAIVALMSWHPVIERAVPPETITLRDGLYAVGVADVLSLPYNWPGDNAAQPRRSTLTLLEDGKAVGPAHVAHSAIAAIGKGAYSHYGSTVYFSTASGADPRLGTVTIALRGRVVPTHLFIIFLVTGFVASGGALIAFIGRRRKPTLDSEAGLAVAAYKISAAGIVLALPTRAWTSLAFEEGARLSIAGKPAAAMLFWALVAAGILAFFAAPFLRSHALRIFFVLIFVLGFYADQVIQAAAGHPINADILHMLLREFRAAPEVLGAYRQVMIWNAILSIAIALPLLMPPRGRWALPQRFAWLPAGVLAACALSLTFSIGRPESYPAPIGVPAQAAANLMQPRAVDAKREAIDYDRPLVPKYRKIVMIVDESVRGDVLGINDFRYDNTPFLASAAERIANYGVAVAGANCSAAARLFMRFGLRRDQIPDFAGLWRRMPTLWQYARKAGFRTVLIDGFQPIFGMHSYMGRDESGDIDEIAPLPRLPGYAIDPDIAHRLRDYLQRDEPMLIYVNKSGVHADYRLRFPSGFDYEPREIAGPLPADAERRANIRNYHKALRWSVDEFFRQVLPALGDDTAVIYTSDHGQSLYEGGYDSTHCTQRYDLAPGEGLVPLFVIAGGATGETFKAEAKRARDRASAFEIFPTLLQLMGYADDWVGHHYGRGLLEVPADQKRGFLVGSFDLPSSFWFEVDRQRDGESAARAQTPR